MSENSVSVKISSRLLQEYLAGKIDAQRFQTAAFGNHKNMFEVWLEWGRTIQGVSFEAGGLDEDDDSVVLELGADWGTTSFRRPGQ